MYGMHRWTIAVGARRGLGAAIAAAGGIALGVGGQALWVGVPGIGPASPVYASHTEHAAGILVAGVTHDGPAAKAGVVRGDILTKVDGTTTDTLAQLHAALAGRKPGDKVQLTVRHGDQVRTPTATLEQGSHGEAVTLGLVPVPPFAVAFGLGELPNGALLPGRLRPLPFDLREWGEGQVEGGAIIRRVVPGGPAATAGLQEGDLVTAVDGQALKVRDALGKAVAARKPGDAVTLTVRRPKEQDPRQIKVTLGQKSNAPTEAYLGVDVAGFVVRLHVQGDGTGPRLADGGQVEALHFSIAPTNAGDVVPSLVPATPLGERIGEMPEAGTV